MTPSQFFLEAWSGAHTMALSVGFHGALILHGRGARDEGGTRAGQRPRATRAACQGHRTPLFSAKGCPGNVSAGQHHTDSPCWKMRSHLQRGLRAESRNPVERARGLSWHQRDGDRRDWALKTGWNFLAVCFFLVLKVLKVQRPFRSSSAFPPHI